MTTSQEAREYPPLPRPFVPSGGCTCKGPYGPCESCHENEQAWREWMDEPNLSPREARAYVDADRKARQQEALDARRWRAKRDIDERRFKETGTYMQAGPLQEAMLAGWRASYDASIDAAIAKGERHE